MTPTRREEIMREIERLQQELTKLDLLPPEPQNEPAVVFFEKTFGKNKKYTYSAVRVGEDWYITGNAPGRNPQPRDWGQLVEFVANGESKNKPLEIWYASELQRIEVEK